MISHDLAETVVQKGTLLQVGHLRYYSTYALKTILIAEINIPETVFDIIFEKIVFHYFCKIYHF